MHSVKTHYSAITGCLKEIIDEGGRWEVGATGLNEHMTKVSFITSLIVFEDILRVIHVTHKALQSSTSSLFEAAALTANLKAHLQSEGQQVDMSWKTVW